MLAFKPHKGATSQLAFSPDGASVATCGKSPMLCVTDAATGKARWSFALARPTAIGLGVAFSPNGGMVATVDWRAAYLFDADTGVLLGEYPGRGYAITFTPDGKGLVTTAQRPGTNVTRTTFATNAIKDVPGQGPFDHCNRFRFSPDGKHFAVHGDYEVSVTDAKTGALQNAYTLKNAPSGVGVLVFSPDGRFFVHSDGPSMYVHDRVAGRHLPGRRRSAKHVQEAAFTPDGKFLITVSNDAEAVVWETVGWTEVRAFAWEIGQLKSVAVSPDGTRAACGSDRGRVVVWDLDL